MGFHNPDYDEQFIVCQGLMVERLATLVGGIIEKCSHIVNIGTRG